jgi:hypothetical protein
LRLRDSCPGAAPPMVSDSNCSIICCWARCNQPNMTTCKTAVQLICNRLHICSPFSGSNVMPTTQS